MTTLSDRFDQLQPLFDFFENETNLFEVDTVGTPWYVIARQSINNSTIQTRLKEASTESTELRASHFKKHLHLLDRQFDYLFFSKSKMRTSTPGHYENPFFIEICDWLTENGKTFLIVEAPDRDDVCDLKFLKSKYAAVTLPLDLLFSHLSPEMKPQIKKATDSHKETVESLFFQSFTDSPYKDSIEQLKNIYLSQNRAIARIVTNQALAKQVGVKAVFGGMGTHYNAGIRNPFAVVEVHHSYFGKFGILWRSHLPLLRFQEKAFFLSRYFNLLPSIEGDILDDELVCRPTNQILFGSPHLRLWQRSEENLSSLRAKLEIGEKRVLLVVTSGWVDYPQLNKLIATVSERYPELRILVRPHPTYDLLTNHQEHPEAVRLVPTEDKYDLLALSDFVISSPSSLVEEARMFTDKIIVITDATYSSHNGRRALACRFPHSVVLPPNAREEILENLARFIADKQTNKVEVKHNDPVAALENLFSRIEKTIRR